MHASVSARRPQAVGVSWLGELHIPTEATDAWFLVPQFPAGLCKQTVLTHNESFYQQLSMNQFPGILRDFRHVWITFSLMTKISQDKKF
jgi:hypothetical protein